MRVTRSAVGASPPDLACWPPTSHEAPARQSLTEPRPWGLPVCRGQCACFGPHHGPGSPPLRYLRVTGLPPTKGRRVFLALTLNRPTCTLMEFGRSEGPGPSEAPCVSSAGPRRMRCTWGQARLRPHHRPRQPAATEARALAAAADLRSGGRLCSRLRHLGGNELDTTETGTSLRARATCCMWPPSFHGPRQTVSFGAGSDPTSAHTALPAPGAGRNGSSPQAREASATEGGGAPPRPPTPRPPRCSACCRRHGVNVLRPPSSVCKSSPHGHALCGTCVPAAREDDGTMKKAPGGPPQGSTHVPDGPSRGWRALQSFAQRPRLTDVPRSATT